MVAIEFLARTAVDNDSAVVHVVGPSAPAAFGLAIGGHGKEVAGPIVVLVAVGALGIVGIELVVENILNPMTVDRDKSVTALDLSVERRSTVNCPYDIFPNTHKRF